ncbi:MAG: hypothetical protein ABFS16_12605 [Bacteroidota bacterium]
MRKIAHLCLLLLIVTSSYAQKKVNVLLKNGSVVKGEIVKNDSRDFITVKSKDNLWVFPRLQVDSVITSGFKPETVESEIDIPWFFDTGYGFLLGHSENEEDINSFFHASFNYRLPKHLYAGAGIGVEYYMEQSYIPVFANFEYRFRETRFSPRLFFKTGYLVPGEKQQYSELYEQQESRNLPPKYLRGSGGIMLNPGLGFTTMLGQNFGLSFSLGYRFHTLNFSGRDEYELEYNYNRMSISASIIFK